MALDENNLPEGNGLTSSAISTVDNKLSGLSIENTTSLLKPSSNRGGSAINQLAATTAASDNIATDPSLFSEGLNSNGLIDPNTNPEMYKTIYQSDYKNAWNTLFNEMRTMRKGEVEDDLRDVRVKLAEFENAKSRADMFYGEGLVSSVEHSNILKQIEDGLLRGGDDKVDLVDQLIDGVMGGLSQNLSAEDFIQAQKRAQDAGLLKKTEGLDKSYSSNKETYQSLLEKKEEIKKDLEYREQEIQTGGFGSMFSGVTGRGSGVAQGVPLPFFGGGDVEEDYKIRSEIVKDAGATALSSVPIFSSMAGLSDSWTGDEYFQYKAAEDAAGSISTFEGQVAAILGPAIIQTLETQATNKYLKGVKNPYVRTASALLQFGTIIAGNMWSRNLETKMESGDAYWQKVDMLENMKLEELREAGVDRELTKDEKNSIAIMANSGIGDLKRKNMALGFSDISQFALTFMKLPGLSKAFSGTTLRNIASREISSRVGGRLGINALKFTAAVGLSRELEGMEEGLQHRWVQDYLGVYGQEKSGSFLNNQWNSIKDASLNAVDYGLNMSGLRDSNPDMYKSVSFNKAVQSGRDMATMMTGGGRTLSNWGGARAYVELNSAMSLLGEGGDNINRKKLFGDKKELLYKFFSSGRTADLYDAIYRMGRKLGTSNSSLMTRQEAIEVINEIQQAEKIYNDVFNDKSPLAISGLGINYDLGSLGSKPDYSTSDKKKVFLNAMDTIEHKKRNKELSEKQQSYREGQNESLELYTTSLTKEEQAELDNPLTYTKRKKELRDKLTEGGASLEQQEIIKEKMKSRGYEATPYDQELLENAEAVERAKKENADIASGEKTFIENEVNGGALWNFTEVQRYTEIQKEIQTLMEKGELSDSDRFTLQDLILEANKINYEQNFEYGALKEGRETHDVKRASKIHALGSIIQHIEKYGSKGLDKILPSILENNTKLDETTIQEIAAMAEEVVNNLKNIEDQIEGYKKRQSDLQYAFNPITEQHDSHKTLTKEEEQDLLTFRKYEEAGTIDEAQAKTLANLVERKRTDTAINALTVEIAEAQAEGASLANTADMASKFIGRIESNPASFLLNDNDFASISDETILENAAMEATQGVDYMQDQLKNIPDFSDVESAQRIHDQIKERIDIFKRRLVEAPDSKKDYFENILNMLEKSLEVMAATLQEIKLNAQDRTQEQYRAEERMFMDALSSLGLNTEFQLAEGSVFQNIGKIIIDTIGQSSLNIIKNSLDIGNTDLVGVTLVLQGLLKSALADQSKVETNLKTELKKVAETQKAALNALVKDKIGEDKVALKFYNENPNTGISNILHQISSINQDRDMSNRESALWKYVDHLSPHKLYQDILKEDRTGLEVSSETLATILGHHILFSQAEKQLKILNSDINVTDQLENEKFIHGNNKIEFIPTKQQLQSIRELSVFLTSDIPNKETLTLGNVSAFLQGAAGTGKSKIVLPWAIQTSGVPNRAIYAFGHNDSSSTTINNALGLVKKEGSANTMETFLNLDDAIAEEVEVIIIDEAPALSDIQYSALDSQVKHINALRHANKQSAVKVVLLGDKGQITKEVTTPLSTALRTMNTVITPITSIYRSDNPAIANFQDTFRRRREDLTEQELTVKLNKANPWMPGASGVYGAAGNFKERLILKLQSPLLDKETRVIITNEDRKSEYEGLIAANGLKNVTVMSYMESQGETIDEVYMDIVRENRMSNEEYNTAIYTATSRATSLIVTNNFNLKNTIDPQLDATQAGLSQEIVDRRAEFSQEVIENSKLLNQFEELADRDVVHELAPEESEELESAEDEFIEEVADEESEAKAENDAAEEDKTHPETTSGTELDQETLAETAYDDQEDQRAYSENGTQLFDSNIDVSDKHVLYYPEYDALSNTIIRNYNVLPLEGNRPVLFVKGRAIGRDGKIISGIVVLQQAREQLENGSRAFEYKNKKVYRRVAVIGDEVEIDKMNFLTKNQKEGLKESLKNEVSISIPELGIPGDKSLLSDENNSVTRSNLLTGIIIPEGGTRRLTYNYGSRKGAALTLSQPASTDFLRQNKNLINNILEKFVDQFFTESQPASEEQLRNIKQSRVKIFKKKDFK